MCRLYFIYRGQLEISFSPEKERKVIFALNLFIIANHNFKETHRVARTLDSQKCTNSIKYVEEGFVLSRNLLQMFSRGGSRRLYKEYFIWV